MKDYTGKRERGEVEVKSIKNFKEIEKASRESGGAVLPSVLLYRVSRGEAALNEAQREVLKKIVGGRQ